MLSVVIVIGAMVWLTEYVRKATLLAMVTALNAALHGGPPNPSAFVESDANVQRATVLVYALTALVSVVVGVLSSLWALRPVRAALIMQKHFIGSAAHELRTPLAVLKTQTEVAKLDVEPGSYLAEVLEQNIQEINHMTAILNNLLLFNRVDTVGSLYFEPTDTAALLETVSLRLKKLADQKGIVLTVVHTAIPHVYGNASALEQALFNIIRNAINYTKRGGEVNVVCKHITEKEVVLTISDTGIGIPAKDLPHIFEPFFRSEHGQDESVGTGLGLAIVFEIVKLHNGKIRVDSTTGKGTRFEIALPRPPHGLTLTENAEEAGVGYDFTQEAKRTDPS